MKCLDFFRKNFLLLLLNPHKSVFDSPMKLYIILLCIVNFFFLFFLFRTIPVPYGSSQTRGQIRATAASLHHSHSNVGYVCDLHHNHSNTRSLTHWGRPGIEPTSSWILVLFVNSWVMKGMICIVSLYLNIKVLNWGVIIMQYQGCWFPQWILM